MAKFKNITTDTRYVFFGLPGARAVEPDGVVDVADDAAEAYADQAEIWAADDSASQAEADKAAADKAAADKAAADLKRAEADKAAADAVLAADAAASVVPSTPSEG